MEIVLFEPEIPPNTGNIARLCAATATTLNLVEPLGFKLENRYLKRAGLDYWPNVVLNVWPNWQTLTDNLDPQKRLVLTSTKHRPQSQALQDFTFTPNDCLVFGPETRGLPEELFQKYSAQVRIPMRPDGVRSINLSTCAGIVLYQALIQCGIPADWL
ncbi:MAG: tRNA (cytidine(34)-2'-O)-methyltransferase [Desulfovibrionaceae bacterium]|nr:tRNA (cytidine(34)-2'-O)-methyltransferase [Desulfovibrionaceae bacterium]